MWELFFTFRLSGTETSSCFSYNWINSPAELLSRGDVSELMGARAVSTPSRATAPSLPSADRLCIRRCSFNWSFRENLLLHTGQVKGFSLVWVRKCLFSLFMKLKLFSHCEHLWGLFPWWVLRCRCRALLFRNFSPHIWQQQDWSTRLSCCWSSVWCTSEMSPTVKHGYIWFLERNDKLLAQKAELFPLTRVSRIPF